MGGKYPRLSANQRQRLIKWLPIDQEIQLAAHKQTFKIINFQKPEELATKMPINSKHLRIQNQKKLDTKPRWQTSNKITQKSFRNRAYLYNLLPNEITSQTIYSKLKKDM